MANQLYGIVHPDSGGACSADGGAWCMHLSLRPWRDPHGSLVDGEATVWRWCADRAALHQAQGELPPKGTLVRVTVSTPECLRGLEQRKRGPTEFQLEAWEAVDDPDLAAFAAANAPPAEVVDPCLGAFIWDERSRWYTGRWASPEGEVRVRVEPADPHDPGPSIAQAREKLEGLARALPEVRRGIAVKLYAVWKNSWADPDEDLTPEAFATRPPLESVTIADGADILSIWFGDDGLFWGHSISVGFEGGEVRDVDLAG